jgi:sugar phosphate isomerase/epimerase
MKLGYGTYGMPGFSAAEAVALVAQIGYDGVELATLPGAPASPERLTPADRRDLRTQLGDLGLELPALMLGLDATADDQAAQLQSLRATCQLACDLASGEPPVLVTTSGGSRAQWPAGRERVADHLAAWCRLAGEFGLTIALEPQVGGIVHRPEHAVWLRQRIGAANLAFNYDESHFVLQGIPTVESAQLMVPHAVATHLKDAVGDAEHVSFLLPGRAGFDYGLFFRLLALLGYDGYLTVEVSGMVWGQPDYDAVAAAHECYYVLAEALCESQVAVC